MIKPCPKHDLTHRQSLKAKNLKIMPARLKVLDILTHNKSPISIAQITARLPKGVFDTVTVYRAMETLLEVGLARQVLLNNRSALYETAERAHHHHLICRDCGVVEDVKRCNVEKITDRVLQNSNFSDITSHSLEFFGVCNSCHK
jgi:Fe2+ or Zn2+ uptake regulation protein